MLSVESLAVVNEIETSRVHPIEWSCKDFRDVGEWRGGLGDFLPGSNTGTLTKEKTT